MKAEAFSQKFELDEDSMEEEMDARPLAGQQQYAKKILTDDSSVNQLKKVL